MNEHRRLKKMRYGICPTGCDWIEKYERTRCNNFVTKDGPYIKNELDLSMSVFLKENKYENTVL